MPRHFKPIFYITLLEVYYILNSIRVSWVRLGCYRSPTKCFNSFNSFGLLKNPKNPLCVKFFVDFEFRKKNLFFMVTWPWGNMEKKWFSINIVKIGRKMTAVINWSFVTNILGVKNDYRNLKSTFEIYRILPKFEKMANTSGTNYILICWVFLYFHLPPLIT